MALVVSVAASNLLDKFCLVSVMRSAVLRVKASAWLVRKSAVSWALFLMRRRVSCPDCGASKIAPATLIPTPARKMVMRSVFVVMCAVPHPVDDGPDGDVTRIHHLMGLLICLIFIEWCLRWRSPRRFLA